MSDGGGMNIEAFEMAVARWSADTSTWPGAPRAAAEALLAGSPEARALRADLAALEAELAFAREQPGPVGDDLMARVLADAASVAATRAPSIEKAVKAKRGWRLFERLDGASPFWRAAGACAASALVGVFVGYMSPAPIAEAATSMASLELITGEVDAPDDESFALALNDPEPF